MKHIITVIVYLLLSALGCLEVQACKHQITLRADKSFAEQVAKANTKYCIEDDFDLYGQEVRLPKGCSLVFKGGSLCNGTMIGDNTGIEATLVKILDPTLMAKGSWKVKELRSEWFGAKGNGTEETAALTAFFNFPARKKILKAGVYGVYELHCDGMKNTDIYAYGATLQYLRTDLDGNKGKDHPVLANYNGRVLNDDELKGYLHIYGLTIDGNSQNFIYNPKPKKHTELVGHHTIHLVLLEELFLKDCTFKNSFMTAVMVHISKKTEVVNCKVINSGESQNYEPEGFWYSWEGICVTDRVYTLEKGWRTVSCDECVVKDSYFENIGGSFASANCRRFECFRNKVYDNRGYAFELSREYENRLVDIHDNEFHRVGSSVINMTYFKLPSKSTNTVKIHNNWFYDLGYDSKRTKRTLKPFLMIDRNKEAGSEALLDVEIKNNLFEFTKEAASGLITCDKFVFEGNTCRGFKGDKNGALFYCGNDNTGSYVITNNDIALVSGAVSIIKSPRYHEVSKNKVTTSSTPAVVFVMGENMKETVFDIRDNQVNGTDVMALVTASPNMLKITNNKSQTITKALTRSSSDISLNFLFERNSFKNVSNTTDNIYLLKR